MLHQCGFCYDELGAFAHKNATNIDSRQVFLHFSYCVREQIVGYFVQRSQGREASKGDQVHNT